MRKKTKSAKTFASWIKKSILLGLTALLTSTAYYASKDFIPAASITLPASNEPVALYSNQTDDKLTHLYVESISQAKRSIHIVIYALMDTQIIEALDRKCEEGVPVYIVCDAKACPGIVKKLPKATIIRRVGEGLVHQKILVIDKEKIILGSANFTYSSLNTHGNLVMAFSNTSLADVLINRIKEMDDQKNILPPLIRETKAGKQNVELWLLPNNEGGVERMIKLFQSAKKSIKVAMFTWTRADFTEELIAASKRGVQVEVVIDRYSGKGASAKIVKMLQNGKISIGLSTGRGLLHHKFAYIDDKVLVNGSANWTNSAFKLNDDYFLILYPLNKTQKDKMDFLWAQIQKQSARPKEKVCPKKK